DGQGERAAHANGAVQDLVDAAQEGAAEGRQAVREDVVEAGAFIDAADVDVMTVFRGHLLDSIRHRAAVAREWDRPPGRSGRGAPRRRVDRPGGRSHFAT